MAPANVLRHFLSVYPAPLSIDEVVRELTVDSQDFEEIEALEAAIRKLLAAGLLQRHGELLLPTRTAVLYPA
jgi:hypothetical protein